MRIAEVIHRAVPRRQRLFGGRNDGVPSFASGKDLRWIIRRTFADVNGGNEIGAVTEATAPVADLVHYAVAARSQQPDFWRR